MRTAAVALTFGQDPLAVLTQPPGDAVVTVAALELAQRMRREYDEALIKATARATGAEVGRVVSKALRAMFA